jgi:hypothetical protein
LRQWCGPHSVDDDVVATGLQRADGLIQRRRPEGVGLATVARATAEAIRVAAVKLTAT